MMLKQEFSNEELEQVNGGSDNDTCINAELYGRYSECPYKRDVPTCGICHDYEQSHNMLPRKRDVFPVD